ncbi:MAG: class I SAM-dependent methyltransferase [Acidobacteriota bacterium]
MRDITFVKPDTPHRPLASMADTAPRQGLGAAALALAGSRWLASRATRPLCDDPWAGDLAGEDGRQLALTLRGQSQADGQVVALRTAFFDRQVRHHIHNLGVRQVVLLGAGLDTRAVRLAHDGVRYFEVDRADCLDDKRNRAIAAGYPTDAAEAVACDLETDDLLGTLESRGFSAFEPALFLMENVACYLTETSLRRLLTTLRQADPRSRLIFDFPDPRLQTADTMLRRAEVLDESGSMRWSSEDPLPLFAAAGLRYVEISRLDAFCLERTGDLGRRWGTHLYGIAQVSASA